MMPPMPPSSNSGAPAPMPSQDSSAPAMPSMPCPHCGKPVQLQKHGPAAPAKHGMSDKHPMPKKNAANAPMDELKEVLKSANKPDQE